MGSIVSLTTKRAYLMVLLLTLIVTSLGAFTRLTDSGLGCPDWPGCYGHWLAPTSKATLSAHAPGLFNAWMEMVHRYGAALLSISLLALLIHQCIRKTLPNPTPLIAACAMIVLQATLGMLTVTMTLRPWVVSAHLLGGLTTLSLIYNCTLQCLHTPSCRQPTVRWPIDLALILLVFQIALGAWTSTHYATLACPELPFCSADSYESLWQAWQHFKPSQQADFAQLAPTIQAAIQQCHRIGAVVLTLCLSLLSAHTLVRYRQCQGLQISALILLSLLLIQITLGMSVVLFERPLWLAWAHHLVATLLLLTLLTQRHWLSRPS